MPRKIIKRFMPNESSLRNHKHLSWLGRHLHDPALWHLTRKSVAKAFLVGVFCAFLPVPMQMIIAAVLSLFARSNMPISIGLVWITNPLTIPPIFYFSYVVGTYLLGTPILDMELEFSYKALSHDLSAIWWPLITGSLFCGAIFSVIAYFSVSFLWIWRVRKTWSGRRKS
ncbi:DUF2062 domain-containing protein [Neptunomonas japonica]|uniref:DUF2062 domain-containing protein n=1 Tax=Neptunomonas japonica JAMM 1380 TaxID=1441457 RepID=A0A7R6SWR9_9GAMM|nr:DUF2062 domain-containing protein [Neptunomonas japonica]BBB30090.1 conserved hypothetical protein [Neptunomonas japonica JAMM 1380]